MLLCAEQLRDVSIALLVAFDVIDQIRQCDATVGADPAKSEQSAIHDLQQMRAADL